MVRLEKVRTMENIAYIGLSHQIALQQQVDIIANNVANASTPGFKAQDLLFSEFLADAGESGEISQVVDESSFTRLSQGSLSQTGNPLDIAISGDGYFAIETAQGVRYSRAGNFVLNAEGTIVTPQGQALLDEGNLPINVPDDGPITITADGSVSTPGGNITRIKVVTFENRQDLIEIGNGLYDGLPDAEIPDTESQVIQGAVEQSNVQPVLEITKMIEVSRIYQGVQRFLQTDHDRQRTTIRTLTDTNG